MTNYGRSIVTSPVHSGTRSARINGTNQWVLYANQTIGVTGNTSYQASGWIQTQALSAGARIVLEWRDASNAVIRTDIVGTLNGTAAWTERVATFTSPANAVTVVFSAQTLIEADNSGAAWFDDLMFFVSQ
jgi:hypothetical protein